MLSKIKSIEKAGVLPTYDLQVENIHNFILDNGLVSHNSEDFLLMFKTTSFRDKNEMCDELRKEKKMRQDQIHDLSNLDKGECFISESPFVVKKYKISLPRSAYWKKEHGNFYLSVWNKHINEWKNIKDIKENIDNVANKTHEIYKEIMREEEIQKLKKKKSVIQMTESPETKVEQPVALQTTQLHELP